MSPAVRILVLLMLLGATAGAAVPGDALLERLQPNGFVNDFAGVLTTSQRDALERRVRQVQQKTGAELAVVVIQSLEGGQIDDFTGKLFNRWGVGQKGKNNGVMLLFAVQDRKGRIEVGYGLEAAIPDALAGRILTDFVFPAFKQGRYADGLSQGTSRIAEIIERGEPAPAARTGADLPVLAQIGLTLFFAILVVIGWFLLGLGLATRVWVLVAVCTLYGAFPLAMAFFVMGIAPPCALAIIGLVAGLLGVKVGRKSASPYGRGKIAQLHYALATKPYPKRVRTPWRRGPGQKRKRRYGDVARFMGVAAVFGIFWWAGTTHSTLANVITDIGKTIVFAISVIVGFLMVGIGFGSKQCVPIIFGCPFGVIPIGVAFSQCGVVSCGVLVVLAAGAAWIGFVMGRSSRLDSGWWSGLKPGRGGGGDWSDSSGGFSDSDSGGFGGGSSGGGGASGSW